MLKDLYEAKNIIMIHMTANSTAFLEEEYLQSKFKGVVSYTELFRRVCLTDLHRESRLMVVI